jgi:hypothetical protein
MMIPKTTCGEMQSTLRAFMRHLGMDSSKYHDTITRGWILDGNVIEK